MGTDFYINIIKYFIFSIVRLYENIGRKQFDGNKIII